MVGVGGSGQTDTRGNSHRAQISFLLTFPICSPGLLRAFSEAGVVGLMFT